MNAITIATGIFSTCVTHPFDFLKHKTYLINEGIGITGKGVNMGYNSATIFNNFINKGYGTRVLYTGFYNAMLSRLAFLFGRNNTYKYLYDKYKPNNSYSDLLYMEKGLISGVSAFVGAIFSNHSMIKYIREVGDLGRNAQFHRSAEKVFMLQGFMPYAIRMMLINTCLVWPYNAMNDKLHVLAGDVFANRILSAFFAAGIGTLVTVPIDSIRTRLQYQSANPQINRLQYRGTIHCVQQIMRNEGLFSFYAGAQAAYLHMVVLTLSTIYFCDLFVDSRDRK